MPILRAMMLHSVFFWLDPALTEAQHAEFQAGLRALCAIDVVANGRIGTPAATASRPVTDHSFHHSLFLEFQSVESHNAYQVHPDHDVFVKQFSPWFRTVRVYDTELAPAA
jgi:hypothetical protein